MNIEAFRDYCLNKKGVEETFPFGDDTLVFKLCGKIFALTSFSEPDRCNLKCDPQYAIELRADYTSVLPGYHMSKAHWNTIIYHGDVNDTLLYQLIDHSYELILQKLPKKIQVNLS